MNLTREQLLNTIFFTPVQYWRPGNKGKKRLVWVPLGRRDNTEETVHLVFKLMRGKASAYRAHINLTWVHEYLKGAEAHLEHSKLVKIIRKSMELSYINHNNLTIREIGQLTFLAQLYFIEKGLIK